MDAVSFEHVSDTDWLQTRLYKRDFGRPVKGKTPVIAMITGDFGGSKGIRTPDPLHAMQVRYRAAPWTHVCFS